MKMNSKISPGEFLGYSTTIIFCAVLIFIGSDAVGHLTAAWLMYLAIGALVPMVPVPATFLWLKLWAMYKADTVGGKKPVARRLPANKG
jgi:uncharacterized membrane protein